MLDVAKLMTTFLGGSGCSRCWLALDLTSNQQLADEPHIRHWPAYTQCYPFKEQPCAPRVVYEPRSSAVTPATAQVTPTTPLLAPRASAYVTPWNDRRMSAKRRRKAGN